MSSTNRGRKRNRNDNYPTPSWPVRRLLEAVPLPGGLWLEPCAGDGAIIRAIQELKVPPHPLSGLPTRWVAIEKRPVVLSKLNSIARCVDVYIGDFFELSKKDSTTFEVSVQNPPFSLAQQFIDACRKICRHTVVLLRLNYLSSEERAAFMRETKPDVYVLPNRPSFYRKVRSKTHRSKKIAGRHQKLLQKLKKRRAGSTDSIEYAWFHWWEGSTGKYVILNSTPLAERKLG